MNDDRKNIVMPGVAKLIDVWASNLMSIADEIRGLDTDNRTEFVSKIVKAQYISAFMDERFHMAVCANYPRGISVEENLKLSTLVNEDLVKRFSIINQTANEIFGDHND